MRRQSRRDLCQTLAWLPLLAYPALAGCAARPSASSLDEAIRHGRFDRALSIATALRKRNGDTAELRLLTGASFFAREDFAEARRAFASTEIAGTHLLPEFDDQPKDLLLRTDVGQEHWLALSTLRLERSLSQTLMIDTLGRVMIGTSPPERYVEERIRDARRVADATILGIASSPGRDAMLDRRASACAAEYRCTGYFVAAEAALARDDRSEAREMLDRATQRDVPLLEFHVAQAELQRLT